MPVRLHFSEQYLTFSQSRAHFLRHSNGRWQRAQTLGANPFLILALIKIPFTQVDRVDILSMFQPHLMNRDVAH